MADWYPHYMGDYASKTARLSVMEHGAYRLLMDYCYSTEGPLPTDVQEVFRICRAIKQSEKAAVLVILSSFFEAKPDGYHNGRVDAQLVKMQDKSGKSSKAAKIKWAKVHADASAVASAPAMPPEPEPEPEKGLKTKTLPATQASHRLLEIWQEGRGQLPEVRELTPDRLSKCRARIRNHASDPERFLADFKEAVRKATQNYFLTGSDGGWKANFDWFIANDSNYLKVIEGKYGDGNGRTGSPQQSTDARKNRADERRERSQKTIESVLGHRSGLVEHLHSPLPTGGTKP